MKMKKRKGTLHSFYRIHFKYTERVKKNSHNNKETAEGKE